MNLKAESLIALIAFHLLLQKKLTEGVAPKVSRLPLIPDISFQVKICPWVRVVFLQLGWMACQPTRYAAFCQLVDTVIDNNSVNFDLRVEDWYVDLMQNLGP